MGRLFWKTLLGFLLTYIAASFGVLPAFSILRHQRSLTDQEVSERIGPMAVELCRRMVTESGPAACKARLHELTTPQFAGRLVITPRASANTGKLERGEPQALAAAPNGRTYVIAYHRGLGDAWPFPVPPEVFILGLVGALAFSAVLVGYVVTPIRRLRMGFNELASGRLETRIGARVGRRRDEIADLARDFDSMAEKLELLVLARDRLLHDVSHELRSPLGRLQLSIALARQNTQKLPSSLDRIEYEAVRLNQMVDELLALARVESGVPPLDQYFDLGGLIASVVEDVRFEAEAREVIIDWPPEDEVPTDLFAVQGNPELVRRAVENVLRNAVKFSSAGQHVSVELYGNPARGSVVLKVIDSGPGVPSPSLSQIFDPFVTTNAEQSGVGLGLSIAQRAIKVHGGTISAHESETGGLAITITLPSTTL